MSYLEVQRGLPMCRTARNTGIRETQGRANIPAGALHSSVSILIKFPPECRWTSLRVHAPPGGDTWHCRGELATEKNGLVLMEMIEMRRLFMRHCRLSRFTLSVSSVGTLTLESDTVAEAAFILS